MNSIRCIVAATNANGEPDLYFVMVYATEEQINNGEHYEVACAKACEEGYDAVLAYDERDTAGKAMLPLFEWNTAPVVDISV